MRVGHGWHTLSRKLSVLVTTLVAVMVVAVSVAVYRELTHALIRAAGGRIAGAAQQVAMTLAESNDRLRREGTPLAHDPVFRTALVQQDSAALAAARARMLAELAQNPLVAAIELWTRSGHEPLATIPESARIVNPGVPARMLAAPQGPLVAAGDTVFTDMRVPVLSQKGDTIGMLRELTRVSSGPTTKLLEGLIGRGAILLVGNATGDVWTDLARRAPAPPVARDLGVALNSTYGSGLNVIASSVRVRNAPWRVWIALPDSVVLADARSLLYRIIAISLLVILLGALGAWGLGRYLLAPLGEVTRAAEKIASGDYSQRVHATRRDEVGELAQAFNVMGSSIQLAKEELESQAVELETQQTELEEANEALRDQIDREHQLEGQLRQARKLEAVGQLAGGIAHDFNNLLTVIISYSEMMAAAPDLTETVASDLAQVRSAADRAAVLTRQLLAFSRKQALRPTVVDINAVVDETTAMLSRVLPSDIKVETRLDPHVEMIYVDRGQFEQVLMNLVVNARDAMPSGGRLLIETANAMLDDSYVALHPGAAPGPHVVLTVRDTGIGMDAATRDRIFEPFFTTKGQGRGTGLGLATIYGIVKQSGGTIYVYSEPGQGTTFKIYFPRHLGIAEAAEAGTSAETSTRAPLNVLVVEDQPAVREAARLVLEHFGHHVVEAPDAQTALDLMSATERPFELVLTDAVMPGQSGLEFVERLRRDQPKLPVILMSGYTEEAARRGRPSAQNIAFLEKPFRGDALARAIDTAISAVQSGAHLPPSRSAHRSTPI